MPAIRKVLRKAIKEGGTTFDGTYLNARGNPGGFLAYCGVYERAGEKCCKCKSLIKKITLANRSTYFCPGCQKPV